MEGGHTDRWNLTRMKLIQATAHAVVENGLRAMTVEHILAAASLSRRTFYQHFRNKEEAVLALYQNVVDDLTRRVYDGVQSTTDPTRRLFAGLDGYLDFQQRGGNLVTLLQAEASNPDSVLSPIREKSLDTMVELVDSEVRMELGEALDPLIYRCLFLGLEGMVIYVRNKGPLRKADRVRVSKVIKHMFVQLLAGAPSMPHTEES